MRKSELICLLSRTLSALSKGHFKMDTGIVLLAVYIGMLVIGYSGDTPKEQPTQTEQTQNDKR